MPASLKNFFARMRSRWRGEIGAKPLIDRYAVETMLERSRIPAVLMLVLVWTVSSVLLILSSLSVSMIEVEVSLPLVCSMRTLSMPRSRMQVGMPISR